MDKRQVNKIKKMTRMGANQRFQIVIIAFVIIGSAFWLGKSFSIGAPVEEHPSIELFFNNPLDRPEEPANALYEQFIAFIHGAQTTLDIALYQLENIPRVEEEILDAHIKRKVKLRLVADCKYRKDFSQFKQAGIPVVFRNGSCGKEDRPIMHNKLLIRDGQEVWTGSYNPTKRANKYYFDVAIVIQDESISEAYKAEFDQLFAGRFGSKKSDNNAECFKVNGRPFKIYFSPKDKVQKRIIKAIRKAQREIHIAMFFLTKSEIAKELLKANQRGVRIHAIWDYRGYEHWASWMDELIDRGIGVLDALPGLIHTKLAVIDRELVILGSMNWTKSGIDSNDENSLFINDPHLAQAAVEQIERLIKHAQQYDHNASLPPSLTVKHHNHPKGKARVEWRPRFQGNRRGGIVDEYRLYKAKSRGGPYTLRGVFPCWDYRYIDSDVAQGQTYYYYLTSVKDKIETKRSNIYDVTIGAECNCGLKKKERDCPDDLLDNDSDGFYDCSDTDTIDFPFCRIPGKPLVRFVEIQWDAPGNDRKNPTGEWIKLKAPKDTDLSGWEIVDKFAKHTFKFPEGFALPAETVICVHSGCGMSNPTKGVFYWNNRFCGAVWNNKKGDAAYLRNSKGLVVDRCFYCPEIDPSPFGCPVGDN